jgi:hypothetical protein
LKRNSFFELAKNEFKKLWWWWWWWLLLFSKSLFLSCEFTRKKRFMRGEKKPFCGLAKNRFIIIIIFKELIFWSCKFARPKNTF